MTNSQQIYEVRPRMDRRGVDLISDALPFGRLWYGEPNADVKAQRCLGRLNFLQQRERMSTLFIQGHDFAIYDKTL